MFSQIPEPNPSVVDRTSRDTAVILLRRFASGKITNDEFQDGMPITHDPAITAIWDTAWLYYSDMREYKLDGSSRLHPDTRRAWIRWMLFLDSDHRYEWPPMLHPGNDPTVDDQKGLLTTVKRMLFDTKSDFEKIASFHDAGHYPVWPFISKKDYKEALLRPRRLARMLKK